jgi:hypothetical protein
MGVLRSVKAQLGSIFGGVSYLFLGALQLELGFLLLQVLLGFL